jgi:hypothetical protein
MSGNNSIFYFQFLISLIALGFSATMLVVQKENNNIYLPFLTSIVFAWIPSPINTQSPNNIKESSQETESSQKIDSESDNKDIESQKLLNKHKNDNKKLSLKEDEKNKEVELKTIQIDKIDENKFIPTILRKNI